MFTGSPHIISKTLKIASSRPTRPLPPFVRGKRKSPGTSAAMTTANPEVGEVFLFVDPPERPSTRQEKFIDFFRRHVLCRKDDKEEERKALVKKEGGYRMQYVGLKDYKRRYLADFYITLIDLEWRYALAIFFNAFLVTYLVFGFLWWLMAYNNGDFQNLNNPNWEPCVYGLKSFAAALLFSIETQTTVGYGFVYPNAHCVGSLPLLFLQVTLGFFLETMLLGFIFVKIARPKYRANTIVFSKTAVICQEDGHLCLQVRVGDLRKTHLVDAIIHGMLVRKHTTAEGCVYPLFQHDVPFSANGMGERIFLMWPVILSHRITAESPLWDIKPSDLSNEQFELLLFLEGTVEATGEVCQARTSFKPKEIHWGHRFERIEEYDIGSSRWNIDYAGFNDVIYCQNIRHSAEELSRLSNGDVVPDLKKRRPRGVTLVGPLRYDLTDASREKDDNETEAERKSSYSLFSERAV